jgi:nucleoside-diphosphate-sugar epimerase
MRAFATGGTGCISKPLVRRLSEASDESVHVLVSAPELIDGLTPFWSAEAERVKFIREAAPVRRKRE